jgi:AAA15 family ATPase/GTPase
MLQRFYVDNFRCLVNFDISFETLNLLMGNNGTGKTTVFNVLRSLQELIVDSKEVTTIFKPESLPRWIDSPIQSFSLEISGNSGLYKYDLIIEHALDRFKEKPLARIKTESLYFNNQPLYRFSIENEDGYAVGKALLYNDDHTHDGVPFAHNWSHSGFRSIYERHDNQKLTWFKNHIANFYILQIVPSQIKAISYEEVVHPTFYLENYTSWLRLLLQENRRGIRKLEESLSEIYQADVFLYLATSGDAKRLELDIQGHKYHFDELSDGQKTIIILYTLIHCLPPNSTLCIDEPENFLALPEIQPWFDLLHNLCDESTQAILISHHPNLINFLADNYGYWFSRQGYQHTQVNRVTKKDIDSELPVSILIERGWLYE